MFYIRTTKTASGSTAVQVVRYENRRKIIAVHIGSAHTPQELLSLKQTAQVWIKKTTEQQSLLPSESNDSSKLISLDKCQYLGIRYSFIREVLIKIFVLFKFHLGISPLLVDLALMRIVEPASKLRSLALLEEYFGCHYERRELYRQLASLASLKDTIETKVLSVAKKHFNFDFSLILYDVTTLYFESFEPDELRKCGFSKDNKFNQPQVLIGLMVNSDGFPVAYEIFEGNKFEGHTLIPVISAFKKRHQIKSLTVVADAAMLSQENMESLQADGFNYIVGARIANLSQSLIKDISNKLKQIDGATVRVNTPRGSLICDFSRDRFRKDKHEMEKQILKAQVALTNTTQVKRLKFLKQQNQTNYELNTTIVEKTTSLLGIKGYYTNLPDEVDDSTIIGYYHQLWQVEQTFRMAKSDLEMRPIYHFKKHAIEVHVLICFMALSVSKFLEIKTGKSIKSTVDSLRTVTDARIFNQLTEKEIILRSEIKDDVREILQKLDLWY